MAKIFMLMDDPRIDTGYAYTNRLSIKNFQKLGYECIAFSFNSGYPDGEWEGCKVLHHEQQHGCDENSHLYGTKDFLMKKIKELNPDILFFHNDFYRQSWFFQLPKEVQDKSIWWIPLDILKNENKYSFEYMKDIKNLYFVTKHAADMVGIKNSKIIPHAIDNEYFKYEELQKKSNIFTICRVDRHQSRKQWPYTLHAFSIFSKDRKDVKLIAKCHPQDICGKDPDTGDFIDLETFSKTMKIDPNKIEFIKDFIPVDDIKRIIYDKSHCFVTTTGSEGFGLSLAEAISRGCVPIYPRGSSLDEVSGDNGYPYEYAEVRQVKSMFSLYGRPDVNVVADKMRIAYNDWKAGGVNLSKQSIKCIDHAKKYNPDNVYSLWDKEIKSIINHKNKQEIMNENKIDYSIIIVSKDKFTMLKNCLDSIINKTNEKYEIIIVSNCSVESNTISLINEYINKNNNISIKLIENRKEGGFTYANNLGIKIARGRYVVLLNNDTIIQSNNWLKIPTDQMIQDNARLIGPSKCFFNLCRMSEIRDVIPKNLEKTIGGNYMYPGANGGMFACFFTGFWFVIAESELLKTIPLNEDIKSYLADDVDYCLNLDSKNIKYTTINGIHEDGRGLVKHLQEQSRGFLDSGANQRAMGEFFNSWRKKEMQSEVLSTVFPEKIEVSIIIPTYNHVEDYLKPCIESIIKYTDMSKTEVIIVANGCGDDTMEYCKTLSDQFKLIWLENPEGYTKSTNEGIKAANGQYIVLLNNDTVLLEQPKNQWIDLLKAPFLDPAKNAGITGPVKFSWDCGGIERRAMAFWCVMIKDKVFKDVGLLDEVFSPGMGEDGDFCIRAEMERYNLVSVPLDVTGEFEKGIVNFNFPIFHKGNGTFMDCDVLKNEIIERNKKILERKYGLTSNVPAKPLPIKGTSGCPIVIDDSIEDHSKYDSSYIERWKDYYKDAESKTPYGDRLTYILGSEFLKDCNSIEDWGCGTSYFSTLLEDDVKYRGIDGTKSKFTDEVADLTKYKSKIRPDGIFMRHVLEHNCQWKKIIENALNSFEKKFVLVLFTPINVDKTHIIGNTESLNVPDISFNIYDIISYLKEYKFNMSELSTETQYGVEYIFYIERNDKPIKTSIVIPTYNHLEDALKPCLNKVLEVTNMSDKEIIVVSNGSDEATRDYLNNLGDSIRYIWIKEPCGYIRAVNLGIAASRGKFVITLDNDSQLMDQEKDYWINVLEKPFNEDSLVGATGPFANDYPGMGFVIHSGCTMYDTSVLSKVGVFDEIYNPGYLSDSDVSLKIWKAGYKCVEVPVDRSDKKYDNGVFGINFPIVHTGLIKTMDKEKDVRIIEKNMQILKSRYEKSDIKYSIIIPTFNHFHDCLKPCVESIIQFTDLNKTEVIVVSNGSTDETDDYVRSLGGNFRLLSFPDALGYTKATNEGIRAAKGKFVILFNNDNVLLPQATDDWINKLRAPFLRDDKVAISGPLRVHDDYSNKDLLIFFCVMIRKDMFEKVGMLDEIFSPGGGEDVDWCAKAIDLGYKLAQVPDDERPPFIDTPTGNFPIWHKSNQTFKHIPEYGKTIVKTNGVINLKRYNKNVKLNLGAGGIEIPGYLSVDFYDGRANIIADVTKLNEIFDNNSVKEILASHLFEHINPYKALDTLKGWFNILEPGGKLIMEMPNIEELCKRFVNAEIGERYGILNAIYGSVNTHQALDDPNLDPSLITSPHLFGWWPQSLGDHLYNAGFVNIAFGPEQIPHPESNFRVEAMKPGIPENQPVKRQENIDEERLTITIPTRNREEHLRLLLTSLSNQSFQDWDLIICNDGNVFSQFTETTINILKGSRDVKIIKGVQKGPAYAHDLLWREAKTEWVYRIDDDNTLDKDCIKNLFEARKIDSNIGAIAPLVLSPAKTIQQQSQTGNPPPVVIEDFLSAATLQQNKWINCVDLIQTEHLHSSFMYRRSLAEKVGGFIYNQNPNSIVSYGEETIFTYKLHKLGSKLIVNQKAMIFHFLAETGGTRDNTAYRDSVHSDFTAFLEHIKTL